MRPKIFIALVLAGLLGCWAIFLLRSSTGRPASTTTPPSPTETSILTSQPSATSNFPPLTNLSAARENIVPSPSDEHAAYVKTRIAELRELQTRDDAQSLQTILSELTNSDKTIRDAALESTLQFGSRDAIPVLNNLAANTPSPDEKKKLLDAADFLALPTLTEVRQQNPHVKIRNVTPLPTPPP